MAIFTLTGLAIGASKVVSGVGKGLLGVGKGAAKAGVKTVKSGKKMASSMMKRSPKKGGAIVKSSGGTLVASPQTLKPVSTAPSTKKVGDRNIDSVLDRIDKSLFNMINVVAHSSKLKKKKADAQQKQRVRTGRRMREGILESSASVAKKIGSTATAPVKGLGGILSDFFGNIFTGSLVLWIIKNWYRILDWIKKGWDTLQKGINALEPFAKWLWGIAKWIAGPIVNLLRKNTDSLQKDIENTPSLEDNKKLGEEVDEVNELNEKISKEGDNIRGIWDDIRNSKKKPGDNTNFFGADQSREGFENQKWDFWDWIPDDVLNKKSKKKNNQSKSTVFPKWSKVRAEPNYGTFTGDGFYKDINTTVEFSHPDLSFLPPKKGVKNMDSLFTMTDYETASSTTIVMVGDKNNQSGSGEGSVTILPIPLGVNNDISRSHLVNLSKVG